MSQQQFGLRQVVVVIISVAMIGGGMGLFKLLASQKKAPPRKSPQMNARYVQVLPVQNKEIPSYVSIQGPLVAKKRVELYSEVNGTLLPVRKEFKEGTWFEKGEPVILVDDSEFRMNLLALKSALLTSLTQLLPEIKLDYPASFPAWKTYIEDFNPKQPMKPFPTFQSEQEKFFIHSKNLLNQYYNIKAQEVRLEKYTLFAPFSGVVTSAMIDPGTLVRAGQKLGEMINPNLFELQASVTATDLAFIHLGDRVTLSASEIQGEWTGTVTRISDVIDRATQSVTIFINVSGKQLKSGMYLKGEVFIRNIENAMEIPRNSMLNDQKVYILKDSTLEIREVEVVRVTEENAIIRGLKEGEQLMNETPVGKQNGMIVKPFRK